MPRHCIIIHGCPSDREQAMNPETRTYDKHWIPWTRRTLIGLGVPTESPLMPDPWHPDYSRFKDEFEKSDIDENTILVGHSCGCTFIVRWLSETKRRVAKLILVAPWRMLRNEEFKEFYEYDIDPGIGSRAEIVIFTADDEAPEGKDGARMYHAALGGRLIELPGRGHYVMRHMGTEKFPEIVAEVMRGSG